METLKVNQVYAYVITYDQFDTWAIILWSGKGIVFEDI